MSQVAKKKQEEPPVIDINIGWCKGCAICVEFCPTDVLVMDNTHPVVAKLEECTRCQLCDLLCPDFAITVK